MSSTVSSLFSDSSGNISISTTSSGEINDGGGRLRSRCVGRSKVVEWGFTSVIGRRKEMEDAVAVVPGFMSRTCDHVGGCVSDGGGEVAPVHFFGVYDGHGGSQVSFYIYNFCYLYIIYILLYMSISACINTCWRSFWNQSTYF